MRQYNNTVNPIERVIAALSYLTAGIAGIVWIIIAAVMKKTIRSFLMYHISQSIFIYFAYYLLLIFCGLAEKIPLINSIVFLLGAFLGAPLPLFWGLSILQVLTSAFIIYLTLTSFMGLYSYVPWVSDIMKNNLGLK